MQDNVKLTLTEVKIVCRVYVSVIGCGQIQWSNGLGNNYMTYKETEQHINGRKYFVADGFSNGSVFFNKI